MNYISLRDEHSGAVGVISSHLFILIRIILVRLVHYSPADLVVYCIYTDWFASDVDTFALPSGKVNPTRLDGIFLSIAEMEVA